MKKTIFILLVTGISNFLFFQNIYAQNIFEPKEISGKVKTLKQRVYSAKLMFGEAVKVDYINQWSIYDNCNKTFKNGSLIEDINYNPDGSFKSKISEKFDDKGNLVEHKETEDDKINILYYIYKYDSKGNILEKYTYSELNEQNSDNDFLKKFVYKYDNRNNLIEKIDYDRFCPKGIKTEFKYHSNNNISEKIEYNSDGEIEKQSEYNTAGNLTFEKTSVLEFYGFYETVKKYDSEQRLTENFTYRRFNGLKQKDGIVFKYDSKGQMIEKIMYESEDIIKNRYTYTYDSDGNLINEKCYSYMDILLYEIKYTYLDNRVIDEKKYNSNGEIVNYKQIKLDHNNDTIMYKYSEFEHFEHPDKGLFVKPEKSFEYFLKYDNNRNWTKLIYYEYESPKVIIERNITYY